MDESKVTSQREKPLSFREEDQNGASEEGNRGTFLKLRYRTISQRFKRQWIRTEKQEGVRANNRN